MITRFTLFRLRPGRVPAALLRAAIDPRRLRRMQGVRFAKVLGTGRTFAPRAADPRTWAVLCVWQDAPDDQALDGWRRIAEREWQADLALIHSRGRWSGAEPFGEPAATAPVGPVAAVTRARLRPRRAPAFRRAVPPVERDLITAPGLRLALPIGEAPIGLQGTFSLWSDARALAGFAYRGEAHREVVRATDEVGWYAEELFARFAVVGTAGTLEGFGVAVCAGR